MALVLIVACSTTGQAEDVSTTANGTPTSGAPTSSSPLSSSDSTAATTTTPAITTTSLTAPPATTTTTTALAEVDTGDLVGWDVASIRVGRQGLLVAVANDPGERSQGLMGVDQLGDLDGMLFVMPQEALSGFWMKGTLIPLDIVFFGDDKALVDVLSMVPCASEPCPSYVPDDPFAWAVETPTGTLGSLPEGTVLSLDG